VTALALGLLVLAAAPATRAAAGPDDRAIVHVLHRVTFGPRPGDVERVRAMGLEAWLERQLDPERLEDGAVERALGALPTLRRSLAELIRDYPQPGAADLKKGQLMEWAPAERRPRRVAAELQAAKILRAVGSERQLQEVMTDFWFNHFNVFAGKGLVRWAVSPYERDVIRPHALGRFPDLLRATARHPAMLFYLDNWLSARRDFVIPGGAERGRTLGLNENYARELMELHTLGVDGGYTQRDVTEVARAFTGWSLDRPREDGRFVFRARMHDRGAKAILGLRLRAGGGQDEGEAVLDHLARHPSTARFIATKLVRRFVSDAPPPALVERVAGTYRATGGDIRAMLRTIFAAPEFRAEETQGAKIKKPFEFVVSALRALGGRVDREGAFVLARMVGAIGEPLYYAQPPTGYADRAEAWVNAGALLARMNFALALAGGRFPAVAVDLDALTAGADRSRPEAVLDRLLGALVHGGVSDATRAVLTEQLGDSQITQLTVDDRGPARTDVVKLAALVLGSPEFQRR
jgi:uncharacterized protein (DUF1800 family)